MASSGGREEFREQDRTVGVAPLQIIDGQNQRGRRSPRRGYRSSRRGAGKAPAAAASALRVGDKGEASRDDVATARPPPWSKLGRPGPGIGCRRVRAALAPPRAAGSASGIDSEHRRHCRAAL